MIPTQPPPDDELEIVFEPDPVAVFIAESLERAGFSDENAWLLATRAAAHQIDWHKAAEMLARGADELAIVKVLL